MIEESIRQLLIYVGENPDREGLLETPKRVLKAFKEMTEGYLKDPKEILEKKFSVTSDEMILVKNIDFVSMCEHHLLPFTGTANVAYIPKTKVVGLSKIARLVDCFARRLQIQELMTSQIADAMEQNIDTLGVAVTIEAHHSCMSCRGVRKANAKMLTTALRGIFKEEEMVRNEFYALCMK